MVLRRGLVGGGGGVTLLQRVWRWGGWVGGCGGGECAQPGGRPVTLGKILESYHRLTDAEQH